MLQMQDADANNAVAFSKGNLLRTKQDMFRKRTFRIFSSSGDDSDDTNHCAQSSSCQGMEL